MNEQAASAASEVTNEVLQNLKGLEPNLAIILIAFAFALGMLYLLIKYGRQQSQPSEQVLKIAGDAVTELSAVQRIKGELQDQVSQLRIQLNELSHSVKDLKEQNETLQKSLDIANKKLEDLTALLRAKEERESELTKENSDLREAIAKLSRQVADLQMQLDQALRKQVIEQAEDTPHEPQPEAATPSPDL